MLDKIGDATLQSPFILFIDSADEKGSSLFLSTLKSYVESTDRQTHVLCWERKSLLFLKELKYPNSHQLHIHDCLADFHGWIDSDHLCDKLLHAVQKSWSVDDGDINVVVDSLSSPLFTLGFGQCLQELQLNVGNTSKNGPKICQLLCLVHEDVLPCGPSSLSYLKHLASTCVEVGHDEVHITHCKPGGHVQRIKERFKINSSGRVEIPSQSLADKVTTPKPQKQDTLPQDVASFRVSLSKKEETDRNKLILPYLRTADQSQDGGGGGKVYYEPDAVDDWDDEDPDDDLDI